MAVNLTPQYHEAEAEYKKAQTPEEKLAALKKMWVILPKHKASEKLQADLKTKISDVNDEVEAAKTGPKKAASATRFRDRGPGRIVFLGGPNARQEPPAAQADQGDAGGGAVPVHHPRAVPGMMDWEDVRVQLIDMPPITADFFERYVTDMVRTADAALLIVDLGDDDGPFAAETVLERLAERKITWSAPRRKARTTRPSSTSGRCWSPTRSTPTGPATGWRS